MTPIVRPAAAATMLALTMLVSLVCAVAPAAAAPGWDWPLRPPQVVTEFSPATPRWTAGHRGLDLGGSEGQPVFAAGPGVVSFVGSVAGRELISVRHRSGWITTYEPVTNPSVRAGTRVDDATTLGTLAAGHPGCPVDACLHWGLRLGSGHGARYADPRILLGLIEIVLKPLNAPG